MSSTDTWDPEADDPATRGGLSIAIVGDDGARYYGSHLHFGLSRPASATDWEVRRGEVRPYEYLNAWRKGEDITPRVPGARSPTCTPAQ